MRNIKARCEQFETQIDYQRAYMSTQDSSHSILKKNTNSADPKKKKNDYRQ